MPHAALAAETGPTPTPDRLSVWPAGRRRTVRLRCPTTPAGDRARSRSVEAPRAPGPRGRHGSRAARAPRSHLPGACKLRRPKSDSGDMSPDAQASAHIAFGYGNLETRAIATATFRLFGSGHGWTSTRSLSRPVPRVAARSSDRRMPGRARPYGCACFCVGGRPERHWSVSGAHVAFDRLPAGGQVPAAQSSAQLESGFSASSSAWPWLERP
jgi:hypothetical protein